MKRLFSALLIFVLALSLCACRREVPTGPETTAAPVDEAKAAFRDVLLGKSFFSFDTAGAVSFDESYYLVSSKMESGIQPSRFTLVDLDQDSREELLLWLKQGTDNCYGYLVLRYENHSVYGYHTTYRNFARLKQDGTFELHGDRSQDGSYDGFGRMRLSMSGWDTEYIAQHFTRYDDFFNLVEERWEVGGRETMSDEYLDIYMQQAEKPNAVWQLFTEDNLTRAGIPVKDAPASVSEEEIRGAFAAVLNGNGPFYDRDAQHTTTIEDYCRSASVWAEGASVTIPQMAVVDMDGDGVEERVLRVAMNDDADHALWVLHCQNGEIQGQLFYHRQLGQLKADGTFWWSGSASDSGAAKLVFDEAWHYAEVPVEGFNEKEDVTWQSFRP